MNTFKCIDCQTTQAPTCSCGSGHLWLLGDEHLLHLGIDAYISLHTVDGHLHLLIKKPSGQESIPLQDQDLITSFTPF